MKKKLFNSLIEIANRSDKDCLEYLEKARWNDKAICVYCKSNKTSKHNEKNRTARHQCQSCHKSFTVLIGTIFESSKISIKKWLMLIYLMNNAKKGISACQVARDLDMRRPTVWSMMHRIRNGMKQNNKDLFAGVVEMDETYVNTKDKDDDLTGGLRRGRGSQDNSIVAGILEKAGDITAKVIEDVKFETLFKFAKENVKEGTEFHTDEFKSYSKFHKHFTHKTVNHAKEFVSFEKTSTNGVENFWSLLKRGLKGQYHHISKKYLQKYVDEFVWKYNNIGNENMFNDLVGKLVLV